MTDDPKKTSDTPEPPAIANFFFVEPDDVIIQVEDEAATNKTTPSSDADKK